MATERANLFLTMSTGLSESFRLYCLYFDAAQDHFREITDPVFNFQYTPSVMWHSYCEIMEFFIVNKVNNYMEHIVIGLTNAVHP